MKPFRMLEVGLLVLLVGWLFAAAAVMQIEYYDGYDSICNAGHFLGKVEQYAATRGPFWGLALIPAEWIKERANMHPLEVRPHHFTSALLHSVYLLGSYFLLVRLRGRSGAGLLAFMAAVPTYLFFTYAPFISHDLLPGLFFLAMLLLAERFVARVNLRDAVLLILLGAAAAMVKHTYALFWFMVLGIQFLLLVLEKGDARKQRIKPWILLLGCAVGSGIIAALSLGLVLAKTMPDLDLVERISKQVHYLTFEAHDKSLEPPWWVYLRNFPAFGLLAAVMILPGLWMGWKSDRPVIKALVLAWLASVIILHLIGIRQVRYLAFVMPITACLIVPPIQAVMRYREGLPAMLAIVLFTQFTRYSSVAEMQRPFSEFYRVSEARKLLDQHPFTAVDGEPQVFIMNSHMMSFTDGVDTPLTGDVYHNLFHFERHHILDFYRLGERDVAVLSNESINRLEQWPARSSIMVASTAILMNPVGWYQAPPLRKRDLVQMLFQADEFVITRTEGVNYLTTDGKPLIVAAGDLNGKTVFAMTADWLEPISPDAINIRINLPGEQTPVYGRIQNNKQWVLPGFKHPPENSSLKVRYFQKRYVHKNP